MIPYAKTEDREQVYWRGHFWEIDCNKINFVKAWSSEEPCWIEVEETSTILALVPRPNDLLVVCPRSICAIWGYHPDFDIRTIHVELRR